MKKLELEQMEQIQGGSFWSWVAAGATCALGAVVTVGTYGAAGEVAGVLCAASIASA
jgi:hypothetical protein